MRITLLSLSLVVLILVTLTGCDGGYDCPAGEEPYVVSYSTVTVNKTTVTTPVYDCR